MKRKLPLILLVTRAGSKIQESPLEERPEGQALGLRQIRFHPDSVIEIPEEKAARPAGEILGVFDRMFLRSEATPADVGSVEQSVCAVGGEGENHR